MSKSHRKSRRGSLKKRHNRSDGDGGKRPKLSSGFPVSQERPNPKLPAEVMNQIYRDLTQTGAFGDLHTIQSWSLDPDGYCRNQEMAIRICKGFGPAGHGLAMIPQLAGQFLSETLPMFLLNAGNPEALRGLSDLIRSSSSLLGQDFLMEPKVRICFTDGIMSDLFGPGRFPSGVIAEARQEETLSDLSIPLRWAAEIDQSHNDKIRQWRAQHFTSVVVLLRNIKGFMEAAATLPKDTIVFVDIPFFRCFVEFTDQIRDLAIKTGFDKLNLRFSGSDPGLGTLYIGAHSAIMAVILACKGFSTRQTVKSIESGKPYSTNLVHGVRTQD